MPKRPLRLSLAALALTASAALEAQDYSDLPPLVPMSEAERAALPPEYRTAPQSAVPAPGETYSVEDGIETVVRTRRIDAPRPAPVAAPAYPPAPAYAPVLLEPQQWLAECRRRTAWQDRDERYDCEGALNAYLSQPVTSDRVASRSIPAAGPVAGSGYGYGYPYSASSEMVVVRTEVPQQVVVRETERYETYIVPGAVRTIPDPAPSARMIKGD